MTGKIPPKGPEITKFTVITLLYNTSLVRIRNSGPSHLGEGIISSKYFADFQTS